MSAPYFRAPFTINTGDTASAVYLTNMCQVSAYATGASVLIGNPSASTAQALSEITIGSNLNLTTSGVLQVSSTIAVTGTISDGSSNLRSFPVNTQTSSYVLAASDSGGVVYLNSGCTSVTLNNSVFTSGQGCVIFNTAGATATIVQGTATIYQAGTGTTGNRSLSNYGLASILNLGGSTFVVSGAGLS